MMTPHDPLAAKHRPGLETRLAAAGNDTDQILLALDTELALRRAGRKLGGNGQVHTMRALSVGMLLLLILGTVAALLYLQSQLGGHRVRPHDAPAVTTANPAPGPSAPDVGPGRQSGPPKR